MKDEIPQKNHNIECGTINPENSNESGSHWVAYYENNDKNIISILTEKLLLRKNFLNIQVLKICFIIKKEFKIIMIHQFVVTYV